MASIREQTLSGVKWNAIGHFTSQGVHFVLGLLIARILLPADYGVIGMLAIFMSISHSFVDSGFSNALIRKIDRTETDCSTVFYFNIVVGVVCYGILYLVAPLISHFYQMPILTDILRVMALTIVISSVGIVPRALRTITVDFKTLAIASVVSTIVSGVIGLCLAYAGYGVWSLVWSSLLSVLFEVVIIWILADWQPKLVFSKQSFQDLFSYGSKILISGLLHRLYINLSGLLIGKFYTPADLGLYSRGHHIATMPSMNITSILRNVTYPILAKLQNDDKRLIEVYRKYISISSLVIFFLMLLLAAISKPLISLLLTDKWLGAVPYLQVFCIALMFDHICQLNGCLLMVKGRSDLFLRLEITKKVIVFPILLLAISYGPMAICWVTFIHMQVDMICVTYYSDKLFSYGYFKQLYDVGKYLLLSIIVCTPAYLICLSNLSSWISLFVGVILSSFLYYGLLHRDVNMKEIIDIIRSQIQKCKYE